MKPSSKTQQSFETPRDRYMAFRETLISELTNDDSIKAQYLRTEFESKLLDPHFADSPEERRTRAIKKWLECEDTNRSTNMRLMHMDETDVLFTTRDGFPVSAVDIADTAARFIRETLGELPMDSLRGSFSGGASTGLKRGIGTIARKYLEGSHITEGAIWHFLHLSKTEAWAPREFLLVRGNEMFTVPKSTVIDRVACKEPDYNMYVQKAVGDLIRSRLKRVGIDLNDQSINNGLALEGSIQGNLATIDLSSASDSVTTQCVLRLLPDDWFHLMYDIRSPETEVDGVWHVNEMFSSMGNAFTFELESLIFWALTRAVAFHSQQKGRISVYGDDIICPSGLYESLESTFQFFGFKVNPKKSHWNDNFRESCGKHFHGGYDVTPFYVKEVPADVSDWILLLNKLRKWCADKGTGSLSGICDPRYYTLWSTFAQIVPAPVWGSSNLDARDQLVAPGRLPIARLLPKQRKHDREQSLYSKGAYLHWLDVTSERVEAGDVQTSSMVSDGRLRLRRCQRIHRDRIPLFPQEI